MEIRADYGFTLEVCDPRSGNILHQDSLGSLVKLGEHALFEALCRGQVPPRAYETMKYAHAAPVWSSEKKRPYVAGIALTVEADQVQAPFTKTYRLTSFQNMARRIGSLLIEQGILDNNSQIAYRVSAFPREGKTKAEQSKRGLRLTSKVTSGRRSPVEARPEEVFGNVSPLSGELFDVYVMKPVTDAIIQHTRTAHQYERASFLTGYLGFSPDSRRVYLAVTGEVPARGAESTCTSFSFSCETFVEAQAHITQQPNPQQSYVVGWEHNHTYCLECSDCSHCSTTTAFWSVDDDQVQASAFTEPYQVALVIGIKNQDPPAGNQPLYDFKLYGWRDAAMCERKFWIVNKGKTYDTNK